MLWTVIVALFHSNKRYASPGGLRCKDLSPIFIRPGAALALPVFADSASVDLQHRQFRVAYVVYHLGAVTTAGHYKVALSVPSGLGGHSEWQFQICDDGQVPKRAAPANLQEILHNAYLVGLIRGDAHTCQRLLCHASMHESLPKRSLTPDVGLSRANNEFMCLFISVSSSFSHLAETSIAVGTVRLLALARVGVRSSASSQSGASVPQYQWSEPQ